MSAADRRRPSHHHNSYTLSGDVVCRYCGYETPHHTILTQPLAPDENPYPVTCEACGREGAEWCLDYTITPRDLAADRQADNDCTSGG